MKIFISSIFTILSFILVFQPVNADKFDPVNDAPAKVINSVLPAIFNVSPGANDATLVLRFTTLLTNAWFDAIAPYGENAVGVYSDLGRQPESERSDENRNIAIFYASYRVLNSLFPNQKPEWDAMLTSEGLDPTANQENNASAIGIGNMAGNAVVENRKGDGMNQLGDEGGRKYNKVPYADYLGYQPVNTAYKLINPSRWQPDIVSMGNGLFKVQQFVTPQLRVTMPYSYDNPNPFRAPVPKSSNVKHRRAYKAQADEVLAVSAGLTDEQKMKAEFFDNKIYSLGFSALFAAVSNELTLEQFVYYDFLTNVAAFDTAIAIWNEKHHYNAVRPFSAIRYLYKKRPVTAWGGPGKGTVNDLPASEWRSYLNVADHPEYPSATASFCAAHAESSRHFLESDVLNWPFNRPSGSSVVEPGITPENDIAVEFATWTEFEEDCGLSRLWAGVHFMASIPAGQDIGHEIGYIAYEFVQAHIDGDV